MTVTPHERLAQHLARYKYKRGKHKGDAPANPTRRGKTHYRVIALHNGSMAVRFHNTDILTAWPDGTFAISSGGWPYSPTTRDALWFCLNKFTPSAHRLCSVRRYGLSQLTLAGSRFYDGMTFDAAGHLTSPVRPLQARRISRPDTVILHRGVKDSGFKGMSPLLAATISTRPLSCLSARQLRDVITDPDHAALWPEVVARYPTWPALMAAAKRDLYEIVDAP